MDRKKHQCKYMMNAVEKTSDTLSSRVGLSLFVRYLENILLYSHLERLIGEMRKTLCAVFFKLLGRELLTIVFGKEINNGMPTTP